MKSIITNTEEKKYYNRVNLLLPIYEGILFTVIVFLLYYFVLVLILGSEFTLKWYYLLIVFALGLADGLSTIYITNKLNRKKNTFYSNFYKKSKSDKFIPVMLKDGFLKSSKGVLLITKDTIEYKVYQMFVKKSLFFVPSKEAKIEIEQKENCWFKRILTLTKYTNLLKLKIEEKEYVFILPCLEDVSHRVDTHQL